MSTSPFSLWQGLLKTRFSKRPWMIDRSINPARSQFVLLHY
ncbi:hypothetical protein S2091_2510 [Solimicrobium silvestre]|uniref:Uncharacterized protein n=1 Tax=Solimicrobium silvestre TaxID=2099400 RepID=A0A2S9GYK4_9BURK|nr:hypothetical protein S2091_2510 [Solimicrobium silvestre]